MVYERFWCRGLSHASVVSSQFLYSHRLDAKWPMSEDTSLRIKPDCLEEINAAEVEAVVNASYLASLDCSSRKKVTRIWKKSGPRCGFLEANSRSADHK